MKSLITAEQTPIHDANNILHKKGSFDATFQGTVMTFDCFSNDILLREDFKS
jgi:hypothetical protein